MRHGGCVRPGRSRQHVLHGWGAAHVQGRPRVPQGPGRRPLPRTRPPRTLLRRHGQLERLQAQDGTAEPRHDLTAATTF